MDTPAGGHALPAGLQRRSSLQLRVFCARPLLGPLPPPEAPEEDPHWDEKIQGGGIHTGNQNAGSVHVSGQRGQQVISSYQVAIHHFLLYKVNGILQHKIVLISCFLAPSLCSNLQTVHVDACCTTGAGEWSTGRHHRYTLSSTCRYQ